MSRRAAAWLAWSLAALCVVMFLVDVALYLARRYPRGAQRGRRPLLDARTGGRARRGLYRRINLRGWHQGASQATA
jgi:hypothetical protein